jgi:Flp pilus assembly CpaE family ATPase
MIEDAFTEMPLAQQAQVLAVLNALHRQRQRNGAALADIAKKAPAAAATRQIDQLFEQAADAAKEALCTGETKHS